MSKAVLVMDMPESCFGCNFLYCNADAGIDSCQAMEVSRIVDSETYEKPYWCPLRELPERKPESERRECEGSNMGTWQVPLLENMSWNACLDEITE